jgi:hypothetical protein
MTPDWYNPAVAKEPPCLLPGSATCVDVRKLCCVHEDRLSVYFRWKRQLPSNFGICSAKGSEATACLFAGMG